MIGEPDHYGWITLYAMPADQISSVLLSTTMVFLAVTLACLLLILLFLVHMQTRLLRPLEDAIAEDDDGVDDGEAPPVLTPEAPVV